MMLLSIGLALGASAQTTDASSTRVVVPIVGSVTGIADVQWRTMLELYNDAPQPRDVLLTLPATSDQNWMAFTLEPGESKVFNDVVGEEFGLGQALSPLMVQTSGRRSVRVRASAYGVRGGEVFKPEPITVEYSGQNVSQRYLRSLSFNDDYRTNIGLANLGDTEAVFVLALQRVEGRNVAVTRITLAPNALWHLPIQQLFPLITAGNDFTIAVECWAPNTYVYASVIENATNSAVFVHP